MNAHPITVLQRQEMSILYKMGKTQYDIAREMGISQSAVSNNLKAIGIKGRRPTEYWQDVSWRYNCQQEMRRVGVEKSKTKQGSDFFDSIDNEKKAYWLGFLAADGYIAQDNYRIQIGIKAADSEHLVGLAEVFGAKILTRVNKRKGRTHLRAELTIHNAHAHIRLNELGLTHGKSCRESAMTLNYVPSQLKRHFIRGYFDGDGSVAYCEKDKQLKVHFCGSEEILTAINNEMGIALSLPIRTIHNYPNSLLRYMLWTGNNQAKVIYPYFYEKAENYLSRKKNMFMSHLKGVC